MTVTSALPYIHGVPHLGNAAGSVLPADLFHRFLDIEGTENIFICGSDVHGTPLELEAIERGEEPAELAEKQHIKVKQAYESLNMDFTFFGNTDSKYNKKQTYDMFEELYCSGFIEEDEQVMPYCNEDERFLPDRYIEGDCPHCGGLARGDQCDDCGKLVEPEDLEKPECQLCNGKDIEFKDTTHLSLQLKPFKEELKEWFNAEESPVPPNMRNQVINDIENAEERSITRDQNWGFDVPVERVNKRIEDENLDVAKLDPEEYEDKVLYVWFDAPIGYIGFTREHFEDSEEWKDHWADDETDVYYSIGKDNTIFHTVIWPSMLLGSSNEDIEYNLPSYEFIQQYLMWNDDAFSKSRGVGIWIDEAEELYPADYWRFYMAARLPLTQDTNFDWDDFESTINNVLNDTVGNFVNRTLSLAEKWFDNEAPSAELEQEDERTIEEAQELLERYRKQFEEHEIKEALDTAVELARLGDQYLSEEEPWNNEDRREETIYVSLQLINALSKTLYPYTPESAEKIAEMLNTEIDTSEEKDELENAVSELDEGHELGDREILFEKIDVSDQKEENQDDEVEDDTMNAETVGFEEFQENDIRIGEIREVEEHPNADKLYKIQIDVGEKVLQTCAGLKNHYEKEELEDRQVVVLANLEPSELRGEKSECMILVAEDEEGNVSLLGTEEEMKIGSEVK